MERRRGRQEKTEETVVSSGWRGKDRKGFLFVYLTPPSFGQLPYILLRYRLGERGKSFALNSFLPFRNFGGRSCVSPALPRCESYIQKERKPKGILPLRLSLL